MITDDISQIIEDINEIQYRCEFDMFAMTDDITLWHYTTVDSMFEIIESRQIWMSDARYLNDKSEIFGAYKTIQKVCKKISKSLHPVLQRALSDSLIELKEQKQPCIFVTSFSKASDSLSQWKGYANQRNGVSIGFRATKFKQSTPLNPNSTLLVKVIYSNEDKEAMIRVFLDRLSQFVQQLKTHKGLDSLLSTSISSYFSICMISFKAECWREECEIRLVIPHDYEKDVKFRTKSGYIIPYGVYAFEPKTSLETICLLEQNSLRVVSIQEYLHRKKIKASVKVSNVDFQFIN